MEAKCERGDVGSASTSLGARLRASPRQLGSRGPRDGGAAAQSPGDQARVAMASRYESSRARHGARRNRPCR